MSRTDWASDTCLAAYDDGYEEGKADAQGEPLTGADVTTGASEETVFCGCGETITFYDGEWLHIYNPVLRGTDDHDASPE